MLSVENEGKACSSLFSLLLKKKIKKMGGASLDVCRVLMRVHAGGLENHERKRAVGKAGELISIPGRIS